MAEPQTQQSQPGSEAVTLSPRDREQVHKLFSNPLEVPVRFKGWMEAYLEPLIKGIVASSIDRIPAPVIATPPGTQLARQTFAANVNVTGTTELTANVVVTAPALAFDGTTRAKVEFFSPSVLSSNNNNVHLVLYDSLNGATAVSLGTVAEVFANSAGISTYSPVKTEYELVPAAGSHVYSVRCFCPAAQGTVKGGPGGVTNFMPGFIKVSTV